MSIYSLADPNLDECFFLFFIAKSLCLPFKTSTLVVHVYGTGDEKYLFFNDHLGNRIIFATQAWT